MNGRGKTFMLNAPQDMFFSQYCNFCSSNIAKIRINKSEWIPRKIIASMKNAAGCIMKSVS